MQSVNDGSPESQVDQFSSLRDRVWLNTAHQGVLPLDGACAAEQAVRWKTRPWEMTTARFSSVPENLLAKLARLLCVPARELVLANSSSYGLHLLANGFPWRSGDEVLVVRGDFPSTYLPWVGLEKRGVKVRFIEPAGTAVEAEDVARHASSRTRVLCTTWVHSFLGHVIDLEAIGEVCRDRGIRFVVNASQGVGARPLSPAALPVDAVASVGFKWLCGPYGTGFCWIRSEMLKELELNRVYWLTYMTADDLERDEHIDISADLGGRRAVPALRVRPVVEEPTVAQAGDDQPVLQRGSGERAGTGYRELSFTASTTHEGRFLLRLYEHRGRRPRVHPRAMVAPTAVLCGDVTVGADSHVLWGAALIAESGPVRVGKSSLIMEHAVLRGVRRHPLTIGDHVLVGPQAHLSGCAVEDDVFLATGATLFNGARVRRGSVVRVNGVVQVNAHLPPRSDVPIGWVAVGDPVEIHPPASKDAILEGLRSQGFSKTVFGLDASRSMEDLTGRYGDALRALSAVRRISADPGAEGRKE